MTARGAIEPSRRRSPSAYCCAIADIEGATRREGDRTQMLSGPPSITESRLDGCERHVVGNYRLSEALEGERAKLFSRDASL